MFCDDIDNMQTLCINNPFDNAPVFYEEIVSSTMDVSRALDAQGVPHGTVIMAGMQESGRGRNSGRVWRSDHGNLYFTILLRYTSVIPPAITLKTGLAVSRSIENFSQPHISIAHKYEKPFALVKWPNDIMINGKKIAGIIGEANGGTVFIGIGVNVSQKIFPDFLRNKASSLALTLDLPDGEDYRFALLETILLFLYEELNRTDDLWVTRLSERLYLNGKTVCFLAGGADSNCRIEGVLHGINKTGELLILRPGIDAPEAFINGELDVYAH